MQDFRTYSFKLTVSELEKIVKDGLEVVAIVNGEYYDIVSEKEEKETINESDIF